MSTLKAIFSLGSVLLLISCLGDIQSTEIEARDLFLYLSLNLGGKIGVVLREKNFDFFVLRDATEENKIDVFPILKGSFFIPGKYETVRISVSEHSVKAGLTRCFVGDDRSFWCVGTTNLKEASKNDMSNLLSILKESRDFGVYLKQLGEEI